MDEKLRLLASFAVRVGESVLPAPITYQWPIHMSQVTDLIVELSYLFNGVAVSKAPRNITSSYGFDRRNQIHDILLAAIIAHDVTLVYRKKHRRTISEVERYIVGEHSTSRYIRAVVSSHISSSAILF